MPDVYIPGDSVGLLRSGRALKTACVVSELYMRDCRRESVGQGYEDAAQRAELNTYRANGMSVRANWGAIGSVSIRMPYFCDAVSVHRAVNTTSLRRQLCPDSRAH